MDNLVCMNDPRYPDVQQASQHIALPAEALRSASDTLVWATHDHGDANIDNIDNLPTANSLILVERIRQIWSASTFLPPVYRETHSRHVNTGGKEKEEILVGADRKTKKNMEKI